MDYNEGMQLDTSRMESGGRGGGRGTGGKIAVGGVGGIIILILTILLGGNPLDALSGGSIPQGPSQGGNQYAEQCQTAADIEKYQECRFVAYENSMRQYWKGALSNFQPATVKTFTGAVQTACGAADSSVGPFYCPGDSKIYLDTSFFQTMEQQLGAKGGPAAEAYVVAHEYGHHIQNLTGAMSRAQRDRSTGPRSAQVRLELQADCYAGVWLKWAATDKSDIIENVTRDDLDRAVDAAISVGDDRIQERATGRVDRESWTHGSSAMRKRWMAIGWNSGDPNKCNTFASDANLG